MALHPNFPSDPHAILDPAIRWFPADAALRTTSFELEFAAFLENCAGEIVSYVPHKMARLRQWCEDVNRAQSNVTYDFVFVEEEEFAKYKPKSFKHLLEGFTTYKD